MRERLAAGVAPGRYQILAAINAVHSSDRQMRDTDWSQGVALYDQLVRHDPSPIIASTGPSRSPRSTARRWHWRPSTVSRKLAGYHAYHATRADLLRRLGRSQQSRAAGT